MRTRDPMSMVRKYFRKRRPPRARVNHSFNRSIYTDINIPTCVVYIERIVNFFSRNIPSYIETANNALKYNRNVFRNSRIFFWTKNRWKKYVCTKYIFCKFYFFIACVKLDSCINGYKNNRIKFIYFWGVWYIAWHIDVMGRDADRGITRLICDVRWFQRTLINEPLD